MYAAKGWYTRRLSGFVRWAVRRRVSPDAFTWAGVAGGAAAAGLLAASAVHPNPFWAVPVAAALAVRLAGSNLDGAVARARDVAWPWGFVVNEIGDRLADLLVMLVLAALAGAGSAGPGRGWGLLALAGSTLPTFASLAVCAAGGPRTNGGPVGKTERCTLVVLVSLLLPWWPGVTATVAAVIGLGGLVTAGIRLRAGARALAGSRPSVAGSGA